MSYRSNGDMLGYTSDAIECLNYAMPYASISNNSWGGGNYSSALASIINNNPDHLFVTSAGNDNRNHDLGARYPCDYDKSLCVASSSRTDGYSGFSDYGSKVDIAAPGDFIWSTVWLKNRENEYVPMSGTSMASPHVAGLAALLKCYNNDLTSDQIKTAIVSTGDPISGKHTATNKRINALKALQSVSAGSSTTA